MAADASAPETALLLAPRDWRADWTAERTCLYWYLTFDAQPAFHDLVADVAGNLRRVPSVDVVPPGWLHLTLLEVGYADEVTEAETAALVAAARAVVAMLPLELELGPITTMTDAVVLQVADSLPLAALQATLAEGLLASRGERPDPGLGEPFWPHVSLGYVNRDSSRAEVLAALSGEAARTVTVSVPRLTLAAVSRMHDHYRWSAVASLPLTTEEYAAS